jgi:hypothetical protein
MSWWVAYLMGGEAVYYSEEMNQGRGKVGDAMQGKFNFDDYYPSWWIGVDNEGRRRRK